MTGISIPKSLRRIRDLTPGKNEKINLFQCIFWRVSEAKTTRFTSGEYSHNSGFRTTATLEYSSFNTSKKITRPCFGYLETNRSERRSGLLAVEATIRHAFLHCQ